MFIDSLVILVQSKGDRLRIFGKKCPYCHNTFETDQRVSFEKSISLVAPFCDFADEMQNQTTVLVKNMQHTLNRLNIINHFDSNYIEILILGVEVNVLVEHQVLTCYKRKIYGGNLFLFLALRSIP